MDNLPMKYKLQILDHYLTNQDVLISIRTKNKTLGGIWIRADWRTSGYKTIFKTKLYDRKGGDLVWYNYVKI